MSECPYKFDGVQCVEGFAHEGDHHAEIKSQTRTYPLDWPYEPGQRDRDRERGFVPCLAEHPDSEDIRGTWVGNLTCQRPVGHEGDHEGDVWTGSEPDDQDEPTHVHWNESVWEEADDVTEPLAPAKREIPSFVTAERARRAKMETHLIAFREGDNDLSRLEVLTIDLTESGALVLRTKDDDLIYPAGSWGPVRMEPTKW